MTISKLLPPAILYLAVPLPLPKQLQLSTVVHFRGVFDEFANSNSTNVQDVLDDLDAAIGAGSVIEVCSNLIEVHPRFFYRWSINSIGKICNTKYKLGTRQLPQFLGQRTQHCFTMVMGQISTTRPLQFGSRKLINLQLNWETFYLTQTVLVNIGIGTTLPATC